MTRSTPNPLGPAPDGGAAASRDAARTARRLTDELRAWRPKRSAPAPEPEAAPAGLDGDLATTTPVASPGSRSDEPTPKADLPGPVNVSGPTDPVGLLPPEAPAPDRAPEDSPPDPAPADPAGSGETAGDGSTAPDTATPADADAVREAAAPSVPTPTDEAPAATADTSPAADEGTKTAVAEAPAGAGRVAGPGPAHAKPRSEAGAETAAPETLAGAGQATRPGPAHAKPPADAGGADAAEPAASHAPEPVPGDTPASGGATDSTIPADPEPREGTAPTGVVDPVHPTFPAGPHARISTTLAGTGTPTGSGPGTPTTGPRPPKGAAPSGGGRRTADFRRIAAAGVRTITVPVVAEVTSVRARQAPPRSLPRRKTVIGNETTGSIPVHLLFRDEPERPAGDAPRGDDDGGPATVALAAAVALAPATPRTAGAAPASPTPSTRPALPKHARPEPARPAPTADPQLVERPGRAFPGWLGILGGLLALAGCAAVVWWTGAVPGAVDRMLRLSPRPYHGIHLGQWGLLALGVLAALFSFGGLGRGRVGYAWVLTLFGDYRGSVRRTGLVWISPLLLRRRVDVRLRHWRSEPLPAVDAKGTALDVVVLVVWRIRDTVRAALGVEGHEEYLREQVEAAMARVLSQLPADAFHEDAPTLRDAEAVGEALTRMLSAECAPVGIDVFSAQPTRIEYAPELAAAMRRRRIAAIDAKHRDSVLTAVVDAVDDVVHRLTTRGLVELDDYDRKALVKDLTVAFYTGRSGPGEGA
ncbi:SPFH domain-containing protein [Streptomyces sp. NPDC008121]|uniref:SPFH domain-containing protein n=1 Tax=Streptomyces sp. NPDC008121 TaxID=3364809 RepID=UPI0036F106ED